MDGKGHRCVGLPGRADTRPEVVRAWVEASCSAQGVPARVSDAAVVAAVAGLLGVAFPPEGGGATSGLAADSDAPDRRETAGIEAVETPAPGADHEVVEHGGDDRVLAVQRETLPALAQPDSVTDVPVERGRAV